MNRAIVLTVVILGWASRCIASPQQRCQPITDATIDGIGRYFHNEYQLKGDIKVDVTVKATLEDCYRELRLTWGSGEQRRVKTMYLAPDGAHVSSDVYNASLTAAEDDRRREALVRRELNDGPAAMVLGRKEAKVQITVFSDFECPYCRRMAKVLQGEMRGDNEERVAIVFRNFPLRNHPWARAAAEAAACIGVQDERGFRMVHDALFDNQDAITAESVEQVVLGSVADLSTVDVSAARTCVAARRTKGIVDSDVEIGRNLDVAATPTVFINGRKVPSNASPEMIHSAVEEAVKRMYATVGLAK